MDFKLCEEHSYCYHLYSESYHSVKMPDEVLDCPKLSWLYHKLDISDSQRFIFFFNPDKKHNGIENSKNNGGKIEIEHKRNNRNFSYHNYIIRMFKVFVWPFFDER